MYAGPDIIMDGLVFGYDTNYGVANNSTTTRYYPGEPTTNLKSGSQTSGIAAGMQGVSLTYVGEEDGWQKYSMTGTFSAGTYPYCMYLNGVSFTGGTQFSTQVQIKTNVEYKFNYFGANGISYVNQPMDNGGINSSTVLSDGSKLLQRQGFAYTSTTNQPGYLWTNPVNNTTFNSATDFVYFKDFQIEQKAHCTPHTPTSRSSTQGLIDLKNTIPIDLSAVSFDSIAQPNFDGVDDKITLSHANSPITNISYEMWIKWDTIPATNSYKSIWQKSANWNTADGISMQFIYGTFTWSYGNSWGGSVSYSQSNFTTGKYYHIVGTVDDVNGTNPKLYVDGVQVGSTSGSSNPITTAVLNIGEGNGGRLDGSLSVFKMYNITLTADNVKQNYNAQKNRFL